MIGAEGCTLYLISRDQRTLQPVLTISDPPVTPLSLEGTVAGRAYRQIEIVESVTDVPRLWVPLLDGTERLGVVDLRAHDAKDLDGLHDAGLSLASTLAELVVSKGQYTDSFERVRRALPMGVAAEMLWRQLPPLTFATERFVVTAQLEPWNEVGGDAFDYSIDGDTLHLAVFDAMGHGLGATMLASVALAAYRNARRSGQDLRITSTTVDRIMSERFGDDSFVTGVLAQLDLVTGELTMLCAGHPAPVLIRGGRVVGEVSVEPGLPFGLGREADQVTTTSLQPADRLLMFSDGVVEARSESGEFFGLDRLLDLLTREESAANPPPETLRRLILAVLAHQQDMLQDDATLLLLEWQGDSEVLLPPGAEGLAPPR
jgi:hypothetical protein